MRQAGGVARTLVEPGRLVDAHVADAAQRPLQRHERHGAVTVTHHAVLQLDELPRQHCEGEKI